MERGRGSQEACGFPPKMHRWKGCGGCGEKKTGREIFRLRCGKQCGESGKEVERVENPEKGQSPVFRKKMWNVEKRFNLLKKKKRNQKKEGAGQTRLGKRGIFFHKNVQMFEKRDSTVRFNGRGYF